MALDMAKILNIKIRIDATMDDFAQFGYGTNGKGGDYDAIYGNKGYYPLLD